MTVRCDGLGLQLDDRWLWRNITFTVEPGEMIAVTGPPNCGKTTLLRVLGGLMQATEGAAEVPDSIGFTVATVEIKPAPMPIPRSMRQVPELVLADDAVVHAANQGDLRAQMAGYADAGAAVVIATLDAELIRTADRQVPIGV